MTSYAAAALRDGQLGGDLEVAPERRILPPVPYVNSFVCPHCETLIGEDDLVDVARVPALGVAAAFGVYMLVCPHCNKPLGSYTAPKRQPRST